MLIYPHQVTMPPLKVTMCSKFYSSTKPIWRSKTENFNRAVKDSAIESVADAGHAAAGNDAAAA
eukprot:9838337-Ditylum_brightwellii.AAC.1